MLRTILPFILVSVLALSGMSQKKTALNNRVNLLFGLNQPLVDGFNIEANLFYSRFTFDYSHGISLDFTNEMLPNSMAEQDLVVHLPYSTGFGIGYRFNEWLNVRLEPKWHKFELFYNGEKQNNQTRIISYNTFSLGIGTYFNWRPFRKMENPLKGIMVSPSIRYWPKLSSSLENDRLQYFNTSTNQIETHKAMEIGIANTPLIVNVSIGYSVTF